MAPKCPSDPHFESRWFPALQLGAKMAPKWKSSNSTAPFGRVWDPTWPPDLLKIEPRWLPKATPKRSKIDTIFDHVFDMSWNRFLMKFEANSGPKMLPKLSKDGANIEPACVSIFVMFFDGCWNDFSMVWGLKTTWPMPRILWPCRYEIHFFVFQSWCCWVDLLIDFL